YLLGSATTIPSSRLFRNVVTKIDRRMSNPLHNLASRVYHNVKRDAIVVVGIDEIFLVVSFFQSFLNFNRLSIAIVNLQEVIVVHRLHSPFKIEACCFKSVNPLHQNNEDITEFFKQMVVVTFV